MNPLKDTNFADTISVLIAGLVIVAIVKAVLSFLLKIYGV